MPTQRADSQASTDTLVLAHIVVDTTGAPPMDEATIEPAMDARVDSARPLSGVPGADGTGLPVGAAAVTTGQLSQAKSGSIGVRYRLKGRFRTCDAIACVPVPVAQTRLIDTITAGDGTRIHEDRIYAPVLSDDVPMAASDENLEIIIRAAVPTQVVFADHPAAAERELYRAMRPSLDRYLLIDGEIWISV